MIGVLLVAGVVVAAVLFAGAVWLFALAVEAVADHDPDVD